MTFGCNYLTMVQKFENYCNVHGGKSPLESGALYLQTFSIKPKCSNSTIAFFEYTYLAQTWNISFSEEICSSGKHPMAFHIPMLVYP